jgi:hypothetical protein
VANPGTVVTRVASRGLPLTNSDGTDLTDVFMEEPEVRNDLYRSGEEPGVPDLSGHLTGQLWPKDLTIAAS